MTALEEIKKAFPNMFRPLKWHHFDGPTEHGCGEWYAHATRGMYHIYDVREKFPNDRPFYAKELSDQFDTLEQAQDAVQNRHELDIVMCLDPDFRSTIESLQRENEELRKALLPFAELPDNAHGKNRYFLELLVCPDGDTPADGVKHYGEAIRTARTALASTGGEHNGN